MNKITAYQVTTKTCAVAAILATVTSFGCRPAAKPAAVVGRQTPTPAVAPLGKGPMPKPVPQRAKAKEITQVVFASRAPLVAAFDNRDGVVDIWNTRTWRLERSIAVGTQSGLYINSEPIALSPDGTVLAYATGDQQENKWSVVDGQVRLWDVRTGALRRTMTARMGMVMAVIWSPDGRYVVVGSKTVRMWDARSGKLVRVFRGSGAVQFSLDGKLLATSGVPGMQMDPHAYLFDVATGRRIRSFGDNSGTDSPVAISPDGKLVATGGEDPNWKPGPLPTDEEGDPYAPSQAFYAHDLKTKIWSARSGRRVSLLPGYSNQDGTQVLHFTPDGKMLFSSGSGYAALWDLRTGKARRKFTTAGAGAISPDGKMVAVADSGLVVLDARTGKKLFSPKWSSAAPTGGARILTSKPTPTQLVSNL